jgi:hypothetical protein
MARALSSKRLALPGALLNCAVDRLVCGFGVAV